MEFSYEGPKKFELKKNILVSIYLLKKIQQEWSW